MAGNSPPDDNPFLPAKIELATIDGETDLEALPELGSDEVRPAGAPPPAPVGPPATAERDPLDFSVDLGTPPPQLAAHRPATDDAGAGPSGMFGPPLDLSAPLATPPRQPASPERNTPIPEVKRAPSDNRFAAPDHVDQPLTLDMSLEQMVTTKQEAAPSEHLPDGHVSVAAPDPDAFIEVPGKLFGGRLRRNGQLHLLIGIVLGLAIGYLAARPVQRRSESRIEYFKAEAQRELKRGHDEAVAAANAFEEKAADEQTRGYIWTGIVFFGVGGGLLALYLRVT